MMNYSLLEEVLVRGLDDWVYDADLISVALEHGIDDHRDCRTVAIGLVAETVFGGLMEAGSVEEKGFVAWTCSAQEAVVRVATEWLERPDPLVMPGEIVWLRNTGRGEAIGRTALDRGRS